MYPRKPRKHGEVRHNALLKLLAISITLVAIVITAPAQAGYGDFERIYDGLLKDHVTQVEQNGIKYNAVDYNAWGADPRYEEAKSHLLAVSPALFETSDGIKTFWINAYNFLTIDLIIKKEETDSIRNLGGPFSSAWETNDWVIGGEKYSLADIEYEILRPMKDPRIHFALNLATRSCPDLRTEAYSSEILSEQLDSQVKLTLSSAAKGMTINDSTLYLTQIMDWYSDDFNDGNVKLWLQNYRPDLPYDQLIVKFLGYDWKLNKPL